MRHFLSGICFAALCLLCTSCTDPPAGGCALVCNSGSYCYKNVCYALCRDGELSCDELCVDPRSNEQHCGGCGKACEEKQLCESGQCIDVCPPYLPERCGSLCVNTKANSAHCGACDKACPAQRACIDGVCECAPGTTSCGGGCVSLEIDAKNCGTCGNVCANGESCSQGRCIQGACPTETPELCFGGCVDLRSNRFHCGTCGSACPSQQFCENATCLCPKDQLLCARGVCVDAKNNPNHCGRCNNKCPSGQLCAAGRCVPQCPQETPTNCFGACVDTTKNAFHCRQCGRRCAPGQACQEGICCSGDRAICGGACVDLQNDAAHCGQCGNTCGAGGQCIRGRCCQGSCSFAALITGSGSVYGRAMTADEKGFVYLAGNATGNNVKFGLFNVSPGTNAIFVAKMDVQQVIQWVTLVTGSAGNRNAPRGIAVDAKGQVYVTGYYTGNLRTSSAQMNSVGGTQDAFLLKLDAGGKALLLKSLGGAGIDDGRSVAIDTKGRATICGMTRSSEVNGRKLALKTTSTDNLMFAQFDANGALSWLQVGTSGRQQVCQQIITDTSDQLYFVGSTLGGTISFGARSVSAPVGVSAIFGKLDDAGQLQWGRIFPASEGSGIALRDAKEGRALCVVGNVDSPGTFGSLSVSPSGGEDGFLACGGLDGDPKWVRLIDGPNKSDEFFKAVSIAPNGEIHVGGLFEGAAINIDQKTYKSAGGWDVFLIRYDASGTYLSSEVIGGSGIEDVRHIASPGIGGTYMFGTTASRSIQYSGKTYTPNGSPAAYLIFASP